MEDYTLEAHEGHKIVPDDFSELPGVHRLVPGNAFCQTCGEPIAAKIN